jgi:hypothetical protein
MQEARDVQDAVNPHEVLASTGRHDRSGRRPGRQRF